MSILLCVALSFALPVQESLPPPPAGVRFELGLVPPAPISGTRFGASVCSGDANGDGFTDLAVGAPEGAGEVHLLLGPFLGGVPAAAWRCRGPADDSRFGAAVAFTGDVNDDGFDDLVVGAPGDNEGSGSVFLFLGAAEGVAPEPELIVYGPGAGADFGCSVAPAGDLNGDGFADAAVGAPKYSLVFEEQGSVHVYFGGIRPFRDAGGLLGGDSKLLAWMGEGEGPFTRLGQSVCGAGDIDGDGFDDLIVGSSETGTVYFGSGFGLDAREPVVLVGGGIVVGIGDIDGDGYADVGVGDPAANRVRLHFGAPGGPSTDRVRDLAGAGGFGASLSAGDVDLDGWPDLLIGAPAGSSASLFRGTPGGIDEVPAWSEIRPGEFGASVVVSGDLDGDGLPEWVIGAPAADQIHILALDAVTSADDGPESGSTAEDPAEERVVVRERRDRSCSMASVDGGLGLPAMLLVVLALAALPRR